MTEVFRLCDDYLTRWAALDPVAAGMVGLSEAFGAATDYGPDGYAAREELIATTLAALGVAPASSPRPRSRRTAATGSWPVTCARTTRRARPSGTRSVPSGTPWPPG